MLSKLNPLSKRTPVPASSIGRSAEAERWVEVLRAQKLASECSGRQVGRTGDSDTDTMVDVRLAGPGDPKGTDEAFDRLRWGGVFACVDPSPERLEKLIQAYDGRNGFVVEQDISELWRAPMGLRIAGVTPRAYCFTARKTHLVAPGKSTSRFTFDVTLRPDDTQESGYCVRKQVPTHEAMVQRLLRKSPDMDPADAAQRAETLVSEIFPIFLTREAKVLAALQERLPAAYRCRVPRALRIKKNKQGFVTRLEMNWLRNGGAPISQIEFAKQSAELLAVLHDQAKVMHLDLRPDNVVITPDGVGFVDFGSAAQVGEDLESSPVLNKLFTDMMKTSQIQRVLGHMIENGEITNEALAAVRGKADRSVDTFYLAVQIARPQANPEIERLIDYIPRGESAKAIEALTAAVLRPKHPQMAEFKTAADVLRGINRIERRFAG